MYDQSTLNLVLQAPTFSGIDLDKVPKSFTEDFAKIVTSRIRLSRDDIAEDPSFLIDIYQNATKLALTYEAYVVTLEDRANRSSAAFIAASAHQLGLQAYAAIQGNENQDRQYITADSIDATLCTALLFFIAGYTADSAEVAKLIVPHGVDIPSKLSINIKHLLRGEISKIETIRNDTWNADLKFNEVGAINALWGLIDLGLCKLATALLSAEVGVRDCFLEASRIFSRVKDLAIDNQDVNEGPFRKSLLSVYTGPRHLASLLEIIAKILPDIALVHVGTPLGLDDTMWREALSLFSKRRPFLWPNHLEAIAAGYLELGNSAVVSFPTGGGKSTLAELKISTNVLRGKAVVFLAPTLALVDQVAKDLKLSFPDTQTLDVDDTDLDTTQVNVLPPISVMTPESCLARMSFAPELFEDVGLFIFDECHLLHPKGDVTSDRRSIDAMLCLLRIIDLSPQVDLLLMSAMVRNNEELSGWLESICGRTVLSLNVAWKPTRQAKGCVVYNADDVDVLNSYIANDAPRTKGGQLTAAAKRMMTIDPYSFFSLNQTWHSGRVADYKLIKLLNDGILLSVNKYNRLTANRNVVAARIAAKSGSAGIKTLIFSTIPRECDSIVKEGTDERPEPIVFMPVEQELLGLLIEEFGHQDLLYVSKYSTILPHHGLLLRGERLLHESLFKRSNGVNILVATSTLAQGINLPAQMVIIAGNTRFDMEAGRAQELDAHELLNAAGRAGRAGESSQGLVLVIPSNVVSFNSRTSRITEYWRTLQEVFSESDQCLDVADPIKMILDSIHEAPDALSGNVKYFIDRVPVRDGDDNLNHYIGRTFAAYQARQRHDNVWVTTRIDSANTAFAAIRNEAGVVSWRERLAASSGIPVEHVRQLHIDMIAALPELTTANACISWLIRWMCSTEERCSTLLRGDHINRLFRDTYFECEGDEFINLISDRLCEVVTMWLTGNSMGSIEVALGTQECNVGKCNKARYFTLRFIPDLSYAARLLSQIYKHHLGDTETEQQPKLYILYIGMLVKHGFNTLERLALHQVLPGRTIRVHTHTIYNNIEPFLGPIETTSFDSIKRRLFLAWMTWRYN